MVFFIQDSFHVLKKKYCWMIQSLFIYIGGAKEGTENNT